LIYCDFLLVSMWGSSNTTYIFMSKNVLVQRVELGLSTDWFSFLWCSQNTFISRLRCFLSILCDNFNFMENKRDSNPALLGKQDKVKVTLWQFPRMAMLDSNCLLDSNCYLPKASTM
jgi:hypothetical protein